MYLSSFWVLLKLLGINLEAQHTNSSYLVVTITVPRMKTLKSLSKNFFLSVATDHTSSTWRLHVPLSRNLGECSKHKTFEMEIFKVIIYWYYIMNWYYFCKQAEKLPNHTPVHYGYAHGLWSVLLSLPGVSWYWSI